MIVTAGSTNVSVYYYIVQDASGTSPGEPVTGLLFSNIETGGSASYARQGAARVDLTLITLASASAAHSDGGFILVDDTNMPGLYRCDYPDAAFATGVDQVFLSIVVASANNAVAAPIMVDITDVDLRDTVRAGLTSLPNAAADAAGGLATSAGGATGIDDLATPTNITAGTITTTTNLTNLPTIPANWLTAAGIAASALDGKGDWNIGKTGYALTQTFPSNFADMSITITTGLIDITQTAADKAWSTAARVLTANTNLNDPTAAAISDAVWDELLSGHAISGSTGEALSAAGTAGDPWTTALPGAYGAGTAGKIIGDNVNATVSSRMAETSINTTAGAIDNVTLVATTTTNSDMRGTDSAALASALTTAQNDLDIITGASGVNLLTATQATIDAGATAASIAALNDIAATDIVSAGAITTLTGAVVNVDLVDTCTTNTDMRGTNSALLAASINLTAGAVDTVTTVTNQVSVADILTTQMTEAYAADGVAPTLAQALFLIQQTIGDFAIAGTTITTKKLDGSTTAATYTLDDGTNPTSRTRTT